jgi:DNA-binding NtrC family response regulator
MGTKVLLVDDEREFVESLSERINMRELETKIAYDGEDALKQIQNEVPDVVVLDLRMPGIDGMEVLKRLKEDYPKVQVIILTGHGSDEDEKISKQLGAYDYFQKPTNINKLVKSINKASKYWEDTMNIATYAEAGDMKSAQELLNKKKKK